MHLDRKDYPVLTLLLLTAAYIIVRTFTVSATFDEVWTIRDFVTLTIPDIISYTPADANNHLLNTLMIKVVYQLDQSLFMARLPALLGGVFYLIIAYFFSHKMSNGLLRFAFFIAITLNPFVLDFFSLARGYSVSLACSLAAAYFLLVYHQKPDPRHLKFILLFSALAVISNFTYLNYFLSVLAVLFYLQWEKKLSIITLLKHIIPTVILLMAIIIIPIHKLIESNSLYYGGNEGIYKDSLHSLTRYSLYERYDFESATIVLNSFLIFLALLFILRLTAVHKLKHFVQSREMLVLLLVLLPMLINFLQYHLFGTKFLVDRTAMLYYPFLMLFAFIWIQGLVETGKINTGVVLGVLLAFAVAFNFSKSFNFDKTATWFFEIHTHRVLEYLEQKSSVEGKKLILDAAWPFSNSLSYYLPPESQQVHYKREFSYDQKVEGDYFLHMSKNLPEAGYLFHEQEVLKIPHDTVLKFPREGVFLFKLEQD